MTAFLLLALAIAVLGAFQTRTSIAQTFASQSKIRESQTLLEELLRLQIDEENSLRGYSLTHDPSDARFYVDQYHLSAGQFDDKERTILATMRSQSLDAASRLLADYVKIQGKWREAVAAPVLRSPTANLAEIDKRNKFYNDQETGRVDLLRVELANASDALARVTQSQLDSSAVWRAFWLLVFGLVAILFVALRSKVNRELEEEQTTTETLKRAFKSEIEPLPGCDVGGAYLSASSHLAVGGDVYDIYRLSDNLALLLIADVSGKGVNAAVFTAYIKFFIRGLSLRSRDPGTILKELNTAFTQVVDDPYLFLSMWLGVLDTSTRTLRYASAGHDSAFIRRSHNVQQLPITGPVLGVMEEPFETKQTNLEPGDVLVLSTDGLTEARDRNGVMLTETGAMKLIERGAQGAQELAQQLVDAVRARGGRNRVSDDLAILAVRILPREVPQR
ncbi:MAG TPA: PP2C family protein-serine/threonine phosphatase [Candidatus Cybelea sp.]|nr:PP2C family protein-serine/threonine phosphatase [Candidatus Cybelea sp.]